MLLERKASVVPDQARDRLLSLPLESGLLVPLLLVEGIVCRRELLHRDQQIPQRVLKLAPVVDRVEKFEHKSLHLHFVQVGEHHHQRGHHEVLNVDLV